MRKDLAAGAANPEHARYRGAADVGVEHPDARATLKRRELINGTACALPCPPSPQVQKSAATSALPGGTKSSHLDRDRRTAQFDPQETFSLGGRELLFYTDVAALLSLPSRDCFDDPSDFRGSGEDVSI